MIVIEERRAGRLEIEHSLRAGRDPSWADLVLDSDEVSRHHLEIRPDGSGYRVWDMGSQNGTQVNGRAVGASGNRLEEGDRVTIGGVIELVVVSITVPDSPPTTVLGSGGARLSIELRGDSFVVEYSARGRSIRDSMPYQLGLSLSLMSLYQRDGLGPVPDPDMRALVWRGDKQGMAAGDINRLLARLRKWFGDRDVEAPVIHRPKRAASSRLQLPPAALSVLPDGWLYRFLDSG